MSTPTPGAAESQVLVTAIKDLATRAFHTFWQAGTASAAVLWSASGLDAHEIASVSGLEKFAVVIVGGAGAAGLSAVKTLVLSYLSGKKALS